MAWIKTIKPEQAEGRLKQIYKRVSGPQDQIDNILLAHSLRPHTLDGHMALYKNVLHHLSNTLPKSLLEALGVYVSLLNGCDYCVQHHARGMTRLLNDPDRSAKIMEALRAGEPGRAYPEKEALLFDYAKTLTRRPAEVSQAQFQALLEAGFDDGQILEANQVIAYFCYANRTVLGLGVCTDGEELGLSPSGDENGNWNHS